MDSSEMMARVKKVIAQVLKIDASSIDDNANFVFDLGADSMQSVTLIAGFEQEFGIEMEEDKALQIQTVVDAVKFIDGYLKK
ncbi:MAG: acyl carrier protein [Ignavibacteriales bacterium]|nr:acyl carrier protein [Ignavibacteriales bacterium]